MEMGHWRSWDHTRGENPVGPGVSQHTGVRVLVPGGEHGQGGESRTWLTGPSPT